MFSNRVKRKLLLSQLKNKMKEHSKRKKELTQNFGKPSMTLKERVMSSPLKLLTHIKRYISIVEDMPHLYKVHTHCQFDFYMIQDYLCTNAKTCDSLISCLLLSPAVSIALHRDTR